jgi:septal ring factor EnvC (AmiA/AmiB activator)
MTEPTSEQRAMLRRLAGTGICGVVQVPPPTVRWLLDAADERDRLRTDLEYAEAMCRSFEAEREEVKAERDRLAERVRELERTLSAITDSANDLLNEMVTNPTKQGNWGGLAAHVQISREVLNA